MSATVWNGLCNEIKQCNNIELFKKMCKKLLNIQKKTDDCRNMST